MVTGRLLVLLAALLVTTACGSDSSGGAASSGGVGGTSGGQGGTSGAGGKAGTGGTTGTGGAGGTSTGGAAGAAGTNPGVYGNVWSGDSLQNWNIGSPKQQKWSYRFRAPRTGAVDHIRVFFVTNPSDGSKTGYSAGTGGTVHVELCSDDGSGNHAPDCATPIATSEIQFALVNGMKTASQTSEQVNFPALALAPSPTLQASTLYHFVFSNVDPSPDVNWIGLDGITEFGTTTRTAGRPDAMDWGLLVSSGADWSDWSNDSGDRLDTPVLAVALADGSSFGCGYMEVWPSASQERAVDATAGVRERFTPSQNVTVTAATIRLKRTGSSGKLLLRLEQDDGTLLEEVSVNATAVDDTRHAWTLVPFAAPHALTQGSTYHLALAGGDGGAFVAHCIRDGGSYAFENGSVFSDGSAEFDRGDGLGWLGWYGWSSAGSPDYKDGDLQLYFSTIE